MQHDVEKADVDPVDADIYFSLFHQSIGIHLTMRCPLRCGHCSVDSGPEQSETLNADLLASRLAELASGGHLRRLSISGGEPFLAPDVLKRILAVAREYGLFAVVNTAAHWAASLTHAKTFLARYPGITHLAVSADEYHEPFVPLRNLRFALEAALESNLIASLVVRVWNPADDPFLERLRLAIGDELWARIILDLNRIERLGRGASLSQAPLAYLSSELNGQFSACGVCRVGAQPVIDSDGTVYPCCNSTLGRRNPFLQLGRLQEATLGELMAKADADPVFQSLRVFGPSRLADMLGEGDTFSSAPGSREFSICDACFALTADPKRLERLRQATAAPEYLAELAAARLLRHGEHSPWIASSEIGHGVDVRHEC